jgi:DNA-binding IclR family transcriptional regulator
MAKIDTQYPQAGTRAQEVLGYIARNPGTTTNGIITGLEFNPSVVRKCLTALIGRGIVVDEPDTNGHHHYRTKRTM